MILTFLVLSSSFAQGVGSDFKSGPVSKKSFVSFSLLYGLGESDYLNANGTQAGYRTNDYGFLVDFHLFDIGAGHVRVFTNFLVSSGNHKSVSGESLSLKENNFGMRLYPNNNLYTFASYGNSNAKLENATSSVSLSFPNIKVGGGIEIPVGSNFFVGVEGFYRTGAIKQSNNSSLSGNSYNQGYAAMLTLSWYPNMLSDLSSTFDSIGF